MPVSALPGAARELRPSSPLARCYLLACYANYCTTTDLCTSLLPPVPRAPPMDPASCNNRLIPGQTDTRRDRAKPSRSWAPQTCSLPPPPPYPESPDDDDDDLREALGYFGWPSGGSILALVQVCTRSAGLLACLPARCQALTGRLAIRLALLPTDGRMTEV